MRTRRLKVQELGLGPIEVRCNHPTLGAITASAEDVSLHGLAFRVANVRGAVLPGDRLESVRVSCENDTLYDGNAVVRRVSESEDDLMLGVELDAAGIDLAKLYRTGTRADFAARWAVVKREARYGHISAEFKAWVGDVHAEMTALQRFLDEEDRALEAEDRVTREQARREYLGVLVPDLMQRLDLAMGQLAALVGNLSDAEHATYRAYCLMHLNAFLKLSPFQKRALEKPLGYAGDYEMMNMLYRDPAEGATLFGQALNICFTAQPAAVANKNRIAYLGSRIREVVARHAGQRVRMASLGCGPARELEALLTESPELGPYLDVALIDQEERAIAHCERTVAPLAAKTGAHVQFIREGLRTLLARDSLSEKLGRRELIYSAGLFDYLDDRLFARILDVLYEALSGDGMLAIGNVATHNPSRWMMEYFGEWFLIHRSPEDLLRLASPITPKPRSITVDAEPSGVNLFLFVQR